MTTTLIATGNLQRVSRAYANYITPVPEPSAAAMTLIGLAALTQHSSGGRATSRPAAQTASFHRTAMAELTTKATDASVMVYIDSRANNEQKADCMELMEIFQKVTQQTPKMWGPSIVGYGSYRYTYESGRTGEMCLTGFAIRAREVVVYLSCVGAATEALLTKLGKHRMTKSCLYFKRLSDLDKDILEKLVIYSIKQLTLQHGRGHHA